MGEIREQDFEWAAIDRMGKMLRTPHPNFQTTHTYSSFASILCWTVQRIRTSPIRPDRDVNARQIPENDPNFAIFDAIQIELNDTSIEGFFGALPNASDHLNSLRQKDENGQNISALSFIVALRNSVAHGDGRSVKPVNRPKQLVGFEFDLRSPRYFPSWSRNTQLNRSAMAQIAGKMVDTFCERFRHSSTTITGELEQILEVQ
ncbi:hypothetical protein TL5118_00984 [Thalassovita autumnalis]|uniref:Uncharacterized protein n=1 Tax=Thalassovita autumnalis TaxID=2072972 RepID=A0A0P1FQT4_9RHOB|nr:hypothetical protein [Thalassovita autumnalis]CUH64703.1 hypothetical protein TL5118_00984 [Thalassovita autumnalis]CUH70812.1 hypothetical protein TL5120_00592 [Thalassovita autumnalis]